MKRNSIFLLLSLCCMMACQAPSSQIQKANEYAIIPLPAQLIPQSGHFTLNNKTVFHFDENNKEITPLVQGFSEALKNQTGYPLNFSAQMPKKNVIYLQIDTSIQDSEAYRLSVNADKVFLQASAANGLFYGLQSLKQLLPQAAYESANISDLPWTIPAVEIQDRPRFAYRGMHLDVARHFFSVAEVKQFIDYLAYHKFNRFHWHLTDDQGWRIEIKKYPKLTEVGAFRKGTLIGHYNDQPHQYDQKRYGGYYTQEEIKAVVEYAAARFITLVPEIEMPGHAQAALAAYPELACKKKSYEVWQIWGISPNLFCPREATFEFLENVLEEVIALFPGKFIHIGGDEAPKTKWKESAFCQQLMRREGLKNEMELQSYFIQRIEKYLNSKGKQLIGWDEILEGGLAPNAAVMSWRGIEGGVEAAKAGHDVVMTPTSHCYFDYYQSDHPAEPLAIGGLIPLEKIYSYEPIPEALNETEARHVLGAQGNLWSEYMPDFDQVEYMAFPRLCALAEVVWSPKENRNFEDFIPRISTHLHRLKAMGVNTANHLYDLNSSIQPKEEAVEIQLQTLSKDCQIHFTTDGSEPNVTSPIYQNPIIVARDTTIKAQAFQGDQKLGRLWQQEINWHHAAGKQIELLQAPHPKYSGDGPGSLLNGVLGSDERYGDAEWLGFWGKNFEAVIDFGGMSSLFHQMTFRFFNGEGQWIYLPKNIKISTSIDGKTFKELLIQEVSKGDSKVVETAIDLEGIKCYFLKIQVENFGKIPSGKQGAGNDAWLFIDEIRIQ